MTSLLTLFFRHSICTMYIYCMYMDSSVENMIFKEPSYHYLPLSYLLAGRQIVVFARCWLARFSWVNSLTGTFAGALRTKCQTPEFFSMHRFSIDSGREYWMIIDKRRPGFLTVRCMIWLDRRHTGKLWKRDNLLTEKGQGVSEEPNYTTSRKPGPL
jgi:hypothetical protein